MKQELRVAGTPGTPVTAYAATTNFVTDGIEFNFKHPWSFQATIAGETLIPKFTIECSNNNVDYVPYDAAMTDINIPALRHDKEFAPQWFRVSFDANGNTTGTTTFDLNLK